MVNGDEISSNHIIGVCPYCKKPIKNIERYYEQKFNDYVHIMCSREPNSKRAKREYIEYINSKIEGLKGVS